MAQSNAVTLTFLANVKPLQEGLAQVQASSQETEAALQGASLQSKKLGESLESAGRQGRATREVLRGLGDSAVLLGGEEGAAIQGAVLMTSAFKDLARGAGSLVGELGLLRVTGIGAGIGLLVAGLHMEGGLTHLSTYKKGVDDLNLALATNIHFVTQGIPLVGHLTGMWRDSANASSIAAHSADELAASQDRLMHQLINTGNAAAYSNAEVAKAQAAQSNFGPYKTGYKYDTNNPGYQDLAYTAFMNPVTVPKISSGASRTSSAVKSGADQVAAALKQAQSTVAGAVRGLADAFKPQFDLSGGTDGFSRVGLTQGASGGGLIGNLKKQAQDTKKLYSDINQLAKLGLNKSLLSQLVAGGLDSLPAAEDLLHGGKLEISQANKYAGQITSAGNKIALGETARDLTKKDKQQLDINVKGGDAELVKLIRKWVKSNGGSVQNVLGS